MITFNEEHPILTFDDKYSHYLMQFFEYDHLSEELQAISGPFALVATLISEALPNNPEQTAALRKLLEAKDCAVRAYLFNPE